MSEQMTERQRRTYKRWTEDEIAFLQRNAVLGAASIATALGRDKVNIYQKAKQLGIDVSRKARTGDSDD